MSDRVRAGLQAVAVFAAVYIAVGSWAWPRWWYEFLSEGLSGNLSYWLRLGSNLSTLLVERLLPLLAILVVVAGVVREVAAEQPRMLDRPRALAQQVLAIAALGLRSTVLLSVAAAVAVLGLATTDFRSRSERAAEDAQRNLHASIEESSREIQKQLEAIRSNKNSDLVPPLSKPATFIYLSESDIEGLWNQSTSQIRINRVVLESGASTTGSIGVDGGLLNAGVSGTVDGKQTKEYDRMADTPVRKLKELVEYLHSTKRLPRYSSSESSSEEIREFDKATTLLTTKYQFPLDTARIRDIRSKLSAEEVTKLLSELGTLTGVVLVEGDWAVQVTKTAFLLSRPFVPNISDPPQCLIELDKRSLSVENSALLTKVGTSTVRMSVLGMVFIGVAPQQRTLRLKPIAVFI